jgi:hypothetical protein
MLFFFGLVWLGFVSCPNVVWNFPSRFAVRSCRTPSSISPHVRSSQGLLAKSKQKTFQQSQQPSSQRDNTVRELFRENDIDRFQPQVIQVEPVVPDIVPLVPQPQQQQQQPPQLHSALTQQPAAIECNPPLVEMRAQLNSSQAKSIDSDAFMNISHDIQQVIHSLLYISSSFVAKWIFAYLLLLLLLEIFSLNRMM